MKPALAGDLGLVRPPDLDARSREQVKTVVLTLLHRILARAKARQPG